MILKPSEQIKYFVFLLLFLKPATYWSEKNLLLQLSCSDSLVSRPGWETGFTEGAGTEEALFIYSISLLRKEVF